MTSEVQQTAVPTAFPLVIPTLANRPLAKLLLRDEAGNIAQQWLIRQNKNTIGSAMGCSVRCGLPGVAPYHALLVIGAKQTFIRALAPKLTKDGVAVNELLLGDENGGFELAGQKFELLRNWNDAGSAPSNTEQDKSRMRFTLARPLALQNRSKNEPLADASQAATNVSTAVADAAWVAKLVQAALQPLEYQLQNALSPIAELQAESRRQKRWRKRRVEQLKKKKVAELEEASQAESIDPIVQFREQVETAIARQSASIELVQERIADVNNQLLSIERLVASDQSAVENSNSQLAEQLNIHNRNASQLESQQSTLAAQNCQLEAQSNQLETQTSLLATQSRDLAEQRDALSRQLGLLNSHAETLQSLQSSLTSQSERFESRTDAIANAIESLRSQSQELNQQLTEQLLQHISQQTELHSSALSDQNNRLDRIDAGVQQLPGQFVDQFSQQAEQLTEQLAGQMLQQNNRLDQIETQVQQLPAAVLSQVQAVVEQWADRNEAFQNDELAWKQAVASQLDAIQSRLAAAMSSSPNNLRLSEMLDAIQELQSAQAQSQTTLHQWQTQFQQQLVDLQVLLSAGSSTTDAAAWVAAVNDRLSQLDDRLLQAQDSASGLRSEILAQLSTLGDRFSAQESAFAEQRLLAIAPTIPALHNANWGAAPIQIAVAKREPSVDQFSDTDVASLNAAEALTDTTAASTSSDRAFAVDGDQLPVEYIYDAPVDEYYFPSIESPAPVNENDSAWENSSEVNRNLLEQDSVEYDDHWYPSDIASEAPELDHAQALNDFQHPVDQFSSEDDALLTPQSVVPQAVVPQTVADVPLVDEPDQNEPDQNEPDQNELMQDELAQYELANDNWANDFTSQETPEPIHEPAADVYDETLYSGVEDQGGSDVYEQIADAVDVDVATAASVSQVVVSDWDISQYYSDVYSQVVTAGSDWSNPNADIVAADSNPLQVATPSAPTSSPIPSAVQSPSSQNPRDGVGVETSYDSVGLNEPALDTYVDAIDSASDATSWNELSPESTPRNLLAGWGTALANHDDEASFATPVAELDTDAQLDTPADLDTVARLDNVYCDPMQSPLGDNVGVVDDVNYNTDYNLDDNATECSEPYRDDAFAMTPALEDHTAADQPDNSWPRWADADETDEQIATAESSETSGERNDLPDWWRSADTVSYTPDRDGDQEAVDVADDVDSVQGALTSDYNPPLTHDWTPEDRAALSGAIGHSTGSGTPEEDEFYGLANHTHRHSDELQADADDVTAGPDTTDFSEVRQAMESAYADADADAEALVSHRSAGNQLADDLASDDLASLESARADLDRAHFSQDFEADEQRSQHDVPSGIATSYEPQAVSIHSPSPAPQAQGDEEDDSVEDYMRKLLARMRGVPEDQVELPKTVQPASTSATSQAKSSAITSAKPNPDSAATSPTPTAPKSAWRGNSSNVTQTVNDLGAEATQPFDPDKYVPRALAPEASRDLNAMRELANTNARTAIYKSNRQRYVTSVLLKLTIAGIGLIVGMVLVAINGFAVNIGLVAALASFVVAIIWGFDGIQSIKPLLQSSLVLQPPAGNAAQATDDNDEPSSEQTQVQLASQNTSQPPNGARTKGGKQ